MPYLMNWQRMTEVFVAGNQQLKETNIINSVQSSLKSHSLWVTLYHLLLYFLKLKTIFLSILPIQLLRRET